MSRSEADPAEADPPQPQPQPGIAPVTDSEDSEPVWLLDTVPITVVSAH